MVDISAGDLRGFVAETPQPSADRSEPTAPAALRALASEPTTPAYSMIVLSGMASAGEWFALTLAGILPYQIHVATRTLMAV